MVPFGPVDWYDKWLKHRVCHLFLLIGRLGFRQTARTQCDFCGWAISIYYWADVVSIIFYIIIFVSFLWRILTYWKSHFWNWPEFVFGISVELGGIRKKKQYLFFCFAVGYLKKFTLVLTFPVSDIYNISNNRKFMRAIFNPITAWLQLLICSKVAIENGRFGTNKNYE